MPKIDIKRPFYTMASSDGHEAEITMYGDIVESWPVDWWTGKRLEGSYITLDEFMKDLDEIKRCKKLTIRMNSYGGDAMVSNTIHNRLREMSATGSVISCIVDGVAMSGGSLIMCACDKVKVNASSLIMIHKCWSSIWGCYNADELRHLAEINDVWDKAQVAIYQRKTGLSETRLLHMMSDTTYLTGKDAVELGFADEIIEDSQPVSIAASANRNALFVGGRMMHLAPGMKLPDTIPTVTPEEAEPSAPKEAEAESVTTQIQPDDTGEGGNIMPTNVEELRAEFPELCSQLENEVRTAVSVEHAEAVNAAVQAERSRLKDIDEVAGLFAQDLVQEAKYGEAPCTAHELTYSAAKAAAQQGRNFLNAMNEDAQASGTENVGAAPAPQTKGDAPKSHEQKMDEARAAIHGLLG